MNVIQKFKFELESLLEFRRQEEQTSKQAYLLALQSVNEAKQAIANLLNNKNEMFNYSSNRVNLLQMHRQYLREIDNQLIVLNERQQQCEMKVKEAMTGLIDKQKNRKVIEKLYEKRLVEYQIELRKNEQQFLDEIGTQNFMRNDKIQS